MYVDVYPYHWLADVSLHGGINFIAGLQFRIQCSFLVTTVRGTADNTTVCYRNSHWQPPCCQQSSCPSRPSRRSSVTMTAGASVVMVRYSTLNVHTYTLHINIKYIRIQNTVVMLLQISNTQICQKLHSEFTNIHVCNQ